jgi:opacity protein-like surface antigen
MRGEITFDFKPKMKAYANTFVVETRELGGSAKLAYDFNNNTAVTPFIFAGLGATNITPTVKSYVSAETLANPGSLNGTTLNSWVVPADKNQLAIVSLDTNGMYAVAADGKTTTLCKSIKMKSKTVMTYQGGFGLSFKASDVINFDMTYGISGKANYVVGSNFATINAVAAPTATTVDTNAAANVMASSRVKEIKFKNQMDQSLTLGVRFTM